MAYLDSKLFASAVAFRATVSFEWLAPVCARAQIRRCHSHGGKKRRLSD
jgi:hypothetical protein